MPPFLPLTKVKRYLPDLPTRLPRLSLLGARRHQAPAQTQRPRQVWLFRIEGSAQDVERYAEEHLAEREAHRGFYLVRPDEGGDGHLLEIHLGGDGQRAFLPALLELFEKEGIAQGIVPASEQRLAVEMGPSGLRTLAVPPDQPFPDGAIIEARPARMYSYRAAPERVLLGVTFALALLSMLGLLLALTARPLPEPIVLPHASEHSPAQVLERQILPRDPEVQGTMRFDGEQFVYHLSGTD